MDGSEGKSIWRSQTAAWTLAGANRTRPASASGGLLGPGVHLPGRAAPPASPSDAPPTNRRSVRLRTLVPTCGVCVCARACACRDPRGPGPFPDASQKGRRKWNKLQLKRVSIAPVCKSFYSRGIAARYMKRKTGNAPGFDTQVMIITGNSCKMHKVYLAKEGDCP